MVAAQTGPSIRSRTAMPPPVRPGINVVAGEGAMRTHELQCMTPLLRFLQLLCENHNINLQVSLEQCVCVIAHGIC